MKHIFCLCLTALLCCLLYTGCKQQPASFVQSAQLSQNEQALLQLLEIEQPQLFDFSVEGAKSLSLELFTLENGSWKPAGSFSGNIDQPLLHRSHPLPDRPGHPPNQLTGGGEPWLHPAHPATDGVAACCHRLRTKRHLRAHRHHLGAAGRAVRALPQPAAKGFLHPLPARLCAGKSAGNRKRRRTAGHPHLFCAAACLIFVLHKLSNLEKTGRMWYNALGIPKLYVR